jgi:polyvinyl alcohol dehydrogenase (cytochrome)
MCLGAASLLAARADAQAPMLSGADVYAAHCAACHDSTGARIPAREALTLLPADRILRTLDFGSMMSIAYPLRRDEREAVARFLGKGVDERTAPVPSCGPDRPILAGAVSPSWIGWAPSAANTRFQPEEHAGITAANVSRLTLKWAYGFAGDVTALAAPTVHRGTLFVGSAGGIVQALDAATGCQYWRFQARGAVRAAITVVTDGPSPALVFGDQIGWVYALDARSGKEVWVKRVEDHEATRLTGSLVVHEGVAFVPAASWEETRAIDPRYACCTFRGSVTAVRVSDGEPIWKTYLVDPPQKTGTSASGAATFGPSGAGIWSAPTIDSARGLLYATTGDNYSHPATTTSDAVVALDLSTGRIVWSHQTLPGDVYNSACSRGGANCPGNAGPDYDFGASAMLVRGPDGRDIVVAGQKSGIVYGLDPATGARLWETRVGKGGINGGVQWGMASDGRFVFAAANDVVRLEGSVVGATQIGDAMLDPVQGGGLTALVAGTGATVWFAPAAPCAPPRPGCSPGQPGAVTAVPGVVFSGSLDGHLRAFSASDGRILWDVDTARTYTTVNGLTAKGGSLDGAGPVVAGGMLFVNSGYPRFGGAPGNVLLAFAVD